MKRIVLLSALFFISFHAIGGTPEAFNLNAPLAQDDSMSLALLLFFAFLGGMILNLMPCVFPILSLKILTLRTEQKKIIQGLFYTLGILVSFFIIAIFLIAMQHLGRAVGWGFQMQSPPFIIGLIFLFTLIALNLFGFYDVPFSLKTNLRWQKQHEMLSAFSTGVLACIVATPCTAPFMATAIGVALNQSSWKAILIFLSLGIGFAMPYLLVCLIPKTKSILPKPGPWMEKFKQFLGFPMLFSVVWLLWVLSYQIERDSVILLLISLCFLMFTLWLVKSIQSRYWRLPCALLSLLLVIYPVYLINLQTQPVQLQAEVQGQQNLAYNPETLANLINQQKKVLVYATATWCITCKMNEHVALDSSKVRDFLKQEHIMLMKADWTNKDDTILSYLKQFNRAGVPLYVYYSGTKEPVVLPQLLTPSIVIDNLSSK